MTARPRAWFVAASLFVVALVSWIVSLVMAWPTYFEMNPATGAIAALAEAATRGRVPGGNEGEQFLATFYFPAHPLLVAAVHTLGLTWKDALRTMSVIGGVALLAAVAYAARSLGRGRLASLLAMTLVLSTHFFKTSSMGGRADLLAAAFSIAALAAWLRDPELKGFGTPALAAGAFLVKATSVTVPIALLLWALARRDAKPIARFVPRFLAGAVVGLLVMAPWGGPRWLIGAIRELVTATPCIWEASRGPAEILRYLGAYSELLVLAALSLAVLASPALRRTPAVPYGLAALGLALFVMANHGAGHNHLDELAAFMAIAAAVWFEPRLGRGGAMPPLLLVLAVLSATWRDLVPVLRHTPKSENRRPVVIAAVRAERGPAFTEDALLALMAGRRPVIADPGALRSLVLKGDSRANRIVDQLAAGHFGLVVLMLDLDTGAYWYENFHLGTPTVDAIRSRYRAAGIADDYRLYRP